MAIRSSKKSPVTLFLFIVVLLIAAWSGLYAYFHPGPWIVPEEAKKVANPLEPSQVDLTEARKIYLDKCSECHGDSGKGDGAQARKYDRAAKDLTDAARMRAIGDGELFYKISEGHRPMPGFKKRLTEEQRWRLVVFLRSFSGEAKVDRPK